MASGFKTADLDLDDVFLPYASGVKPAPTGFAVAGVDLKDRYHPGTTDTPTQFTVAGGADLATLFAPIAQIIPFGGPYQSNASDSHDIGASFSLSINRDGTWEITQVALHGGSNTGTPKTGTWHAAPGASVGDNYEVQFVATVSVANDYVPPENADPTYTPTTGWLVLSADRSVIADTGHLLGGGADGPGTVTLNGTYEVRIRRVGASHFVASTVAFELGAMIV